MPLAKFEVRKTRPPEQVQAIIEAVGIARSEVFIVLTEPARENWGIRGGVPASEMNLGFRPDV